MKKIILISILLVNVCMAQKPIKDIPYSQFVELNGKECLVSNKPVTNREYIIYLMWNYQVYGQDQSEIMYKIFPGIKADLFSENRVEEYYQFRSSLNPFHFLIEKSESMVKDYMFNPKYLDHPAIGLEEEQAIRFNKWLADRYNENVLIKKKYLYFDPSSQNMEECFVTEAYLANQYKGMVRKDKSLTWEQALFIPSFRLPSKKELASLGIQSELKSYPYEKQNFLKLWNDLWIQEKDQQLVLKHFVKHEVFGSTNLKANLNVIQELVGSQLQPNEFVNISESSKTIKNQWGQMPYVIVSEDENNQPQAISKESFNKVDENLKEQFKTFRWVLSVSSDRFNK